MATVTIPNTFTNGTPADATAVNANFTAITAQVNGNLDSTNLADDAVTAAKLADDAVNTANVVDNAITGAKTVLATNNSTRGTVKYKSGTASVDALTSGTVTFTGDAFTSVPVISVRRTTGGINTRQYEGNLALDPGWSIATESTTGFQIVNASSSAQTYAWQAVGI